MERLETVVSTPTAEWRARCRMRTSKRAQGPHDVRPCAAINAVIDTIWHLGVRRTRPASWRSPAPIRSSHDIDAPADWQVLVTGSSAGLGYAIAEGLPAAAISPCTASWAIRGSSTARSAAERHGVRVTYIHSTLRARRGRRAAARRAERAGRCRYPGKQRRRAALRADRPLSRGGMGQRAGREPLCSVPPGAPRVAGMRARVGHRRMFSVCGDCGTVNRIDYVTTAPHRVHAPSRWKHSPTASRATVSPGSVLTPGTERASGRSAKKVASSGRKRNSNFWRANSQADASSVPRTWPPR